MKAKKMLAISLMAVMMTTMLSACGGDSKSSSAKSTVKATNTPRPTRVHSYELSPAPEEEKAPEYDYKGSDKVGDLTGLTSMEVTEQMGFGLNIGNTFDATGGSKDNVLSHETSWGNKIVTQEYVDAIYEAGFTTVRIPTTWANYIKKNDDGTYVIYEAYMNRVREAVDYCYQHDMFVILNVHHENWINHDKLVTNKDAVANELEQVWTQIAEGFADYDQHLIFEVMNEPRLAGTDLEWTGNEESFEVINYLDQVATNAIRKVDKGNNAERCIMVPQYAASCSPSALAALSLPTYNGEVVKNLIVSVHSYTPYDFCLSDTKKTFDANSASDTAGIDSMFETVKNEFLNYGIPVVFGETGATNSGNNVADRANWAGYMGKKGVEYGTPLVLWDNGSTGSSGGECHLYVDRDDYSIPTPEILEAFFAPLKEGTWGSALDGESSSGSNNTPDPVESISGGAIIKSYPEGHESGKAWDAGYITLGASEEYFIGGKDIYIAYKGDGKVTMVLDSEALQQWWMPVEKSESTTIGGYNVQVFKYDDMKAVIESFGLTSFSQLRNIMFVSLDDNAKVTTYEVSAVGDGCAAIFKVNGKTYFVGNEGEMPDDPTVAGLKFEGWYTTKTFEPGTEYKGGELTESVTVFAKLSLDK